MLEMIKSSYFLQNIFFYINDKTKLKLIRYNKGIQNIIGLNLKHYKIFSGRNIIYENKTKGKEYDILTGILLYEGEYLNGERNGKGKEYSFNGLIKFEGDFLNGKKWNGKGLGLNKSRLYEIKEGKGYVTEYDDFHRLLFEGEYLNGERNGKGKEYYPDYRILKFEGVYLNGKKWNGKGYDRYNNKVYELQNGKGFIKEYNDYGRLIFEGEYLNGEKNGIGKEYYSLSISSIYSGKDKNKNKLEYEGEFKNGKRNGRGKEYDYNGIFIFEGDYLYNYRRGGKAFAEGRLEYEGEYYFNSKWNGKGYDENGDIIYEINNGNGKVREYNGFKGQISFEGEILNGIRNGKGKKFDDLTGNLIFEGEYKDGKINGKGKEFDVLTGRLIFEGEYLNGIRSGKGKEYDANTGKLRFKGEFKNGEKIIHTYNNYYFLLFFLSIIISFILYRVIYN